jgi:hypothetical protein
LKLTLASKSLKVEFAKNWFLVTKNILTVMRSWINFGVKNQSHTRARIYRCTYDLQTQYGFTSFAICTVRYITTTPNVRARRN